MAPRPFAAWTRSWGPGNIYVALAKSRVFGDVGIDMVAGPSEVVVVADESADPDWWPPISSRRPSTIPWPAPSSSRPRARSSTGSRRAMERQLATLPRREIAAASLRAHGALVLTRSLDEAVEVANLLAPEHLELQVADPEALLSRGAERGRGVPRPLHARGGG